MSSRDDSWKEEYRSILLSGNLDAAIEAFKLKEANQPEKLYRYRCFDKARRSLNSLSNNTIWLARAETFNDPFDCGLTVDLDSLFQRTMPAALDELDLKDLSAEERTAFTGATSLDDLLKLMVLHSDEIPADKKDETLAALRGVADKYTRVPSEQLARLFRQGTKVACFTTVYDSMPMWAHYTDDHRGFCIEYPVSDFAPLMRRFLYPVFYSDDRVNLTRWIDDGKAGPLAAIVAGTHKSTQWAYEDEWRFVVCDGPSTTGLLWTMPKPTAVYVSYRISKADRAQLLKVTNQAKIPVYEMALHETKYALKPRLL